MNGFRLRSSVGHRNVPGYRDIVQDVVRELRAEGHTVGVFSHHVDSTTILSDQLQQSGIEHEIIGLPESVTAALDAQHTMVAFGGGTASWDAVRASLAAGSPHRNARRRVRSRQPY
jgi:ABC-type branched-subunit amino acid transport system substrate-binding protein